MNERSGEVKTYAMPMDELYKRSNQKLDVAKRGRPRIKNGEIDKVREKHEAKKAWKDIRDEMNKEFKQTGPRKRTAPCSA